MSYQPKTTVMLIEVKNWTDETDCSLDSRFSAARAIATDIAARCEMDIISLSYQEQARNDCFMTVVYINNGRELSDIRSIMASQINNKPPVYWMILDIYEWQGTLECVAATRGTKEEWE